MSDDCWNQIGVEGDRSCPQLKTAIHCRNCSVYSMAGRSLLEREASPEYLQEWTDILAKTQPENALVPITSGVLVRSANTVSVMIFRLGNEWLAFPVKLLQEITNSCAIHSLPHRSNQLFLGLINIRGEILLCVSLRHLLNLESVAEVDPNSSAMGFKQIMVVASEGKRWVFPVDEVCGVHRFQIGELQNTPVVISKASAAYTKGIIYWQEKKVNYLDSDLLFYTLEERIL